LAWIVISPLMAN